MKKNKFKFEWLNKSIKIKLPAKGKNTSVEEIAVKVGDSIKKIDISLTVNCQLCSDTIYYRKWGFSVISSHLQTKKHPSKVQAKHENYTLPANFFGVSKSAAPCSAVPSVPCASSSTTIQMHVNVPLSDRITNAQSLILCVLAENNLPFTMSPVLIELSKVLASDKKALNYPNMSRTAASYKMRLGLAKTFMDETAENLRNSKFSLNIDEAASNNFKRVLSVLVSYFSPIQNKVIIEHLVSVIRVTSESLFKEIVKVFQDHNIPWDDLMSILMDLCNVMRGSKSGLEARIRLSKIIVSKDLKHDTVVAFFKQANQAYVECAQYLQKKLLLNSSLLQSISAIDPIARGHSVTADRLKRLPKLVTNVLMQEEEIQCSLDVHLYQVDKFLPSYTDEHGNILRIDLWWAAVFRSNKYCALSKMVRAILSCFHGPQVESSFSMMGDVLDKESGNMKIETFSAIQTVKYRLSSQNKCKKVNKVPKAERVFLNGQRSSRVMKIGSLDVKETRRIRKREQRCIDPESHSRNCPEEVGNTFDLLSNKNHQTPKPARSLSAQSEERNDSDTETEVAVLCDWYGVSDRAASAIVSAALQDSGQLKNDDLTLVVDRSKISDLRQVVDGVIQRTFFFLRMKKIFFYVC
ncbi:hypothetical protein AVEN_259786-1 [Araneus ventricosus]|uniref:Uncharacterized protein n=1 Tax=Araneus ventricosus TaxID=182803 RepID=A0A4Y1ZT34_ARAVE|nr:hypothetical protein AVEN_259786-1 [Araneus ventricosus]